MQGFLIFFLEQNLKLNEEFFAEITPKVASGEIRYSEHIYDGLAHAGEAILASQKGLIKAKAVVHVADE